MNSTVNVELNTLPSLRPNDTLAPLLFANKMRVVSFFDIFIIREE